MKRINKCLSFVEFNSSILNLTVAQDAQAQKTEATQSTAQTTTQQPKNPKDKKTKETKAPESNIKAGEDKDHPHKVVPATQEEDPSSKYLFFKPDEFIITTYKMETGWWYGYKDIPENMDPSNIKFGFFPSNYVKVVEEFPEEVVPDPNLEEVKVGEEEPEEEGHRANWNDYANMNYLDESKMLVDERMKAMLDPTSEANANPNFITRMKMIKRHETRSHQVNQWKGGKVTLSQVAVKDQSHVAKAYRQMHHYFDYDQWIDQRNKEPPKKAKADITKKKKKTPQWLEKLGYDPREDR